MAALHGAFALAKRHHAAVRVGENLNFDMARLFQIFFQVDARRRRRRSVLRKRRRERPAENSESRCTKRMPLPPPPATAFSNTG